MIRVGDLEYTVDDARANLRSAFQMGMAGAAGRVTMPRQKHKVVVEFRCDTEDDVRRLTRALEILREREERGG